MAKDKKQDVDKQENENQENENNFTEADVIKLFDRVKTLETLLAKIATLSGHGNYLREFGLEPWIPGKKDMGKKYG